MATDDAASDLLAYRQEVFDFLSTVTIKFKFFISAYNTLVLSKGGTVDDAHPETWKYYLNLQGKYHPTDTPMMITSLDTKQQVLFSADTLAQHPRTRTAYTINSPYCTELAARYPDQVDLIKSIIYPVSDYDTIANAEDLTLLAYGTGFLESREEGPIIQEIVAALSYLSNRWYMDFYSYIPSWPWIFYWSLWHRLADCVFSARIKLIKTPFVHSWHIWQYLVSNGIRDYRGSLTDEQQMFLYRNLEYLIANRGKASNLTILADNILSEVGVGLFKRVIYQNKSTNAANCRLTPEFVAIQIPTKYSGVVQSLSSSDTATMAQRLVASGFDVTDDAEYVEEVNRALSATTFNVIPTKFLEIRQISKFREYLSFFNRFCIDTFVYCFLQGYYDMDVEITDPYNGTTVKIDSKSALILYYYCSLKGMGLEPDTIPDTYYISTAFKAQIPNVPSTFTWNGNTLPMQSLVDIDAFMNIPSYPDEIYSPDVFSTEIGSLFTAALNQRLMWQIAGTQFSRRAMKSLHDLCTVEQVVQLGLAPTGTTYASWLASHAPTEINRIFAAYDATNISQSLYRGLADTIMSGFIPANSYFTKYGNFTSSYEELRQLFIDLCSYDVVFLDVESDNSTALFVDSLCIDMTTCGITYDLEVKALKNTNPSLVSTFTADANVFQKDLSLLLEYDMEEPMVQNKHVDINMACSHAMISCSTRNNTVVYTNGVNRTARKGRQVSFSLTTNS